MNNEKMIKKILALFNKNMTACERRLLIKLYDVCSSGVENKKDLKDNLLQIESSFDNISEKFIKNNFNNVSEINFVDADATEINNKDYIKDAELKNEKNAFKHNLYKEYEKNKNSKDELLNLETMILEYYIMLQDCIENYDEENTSLKKRTIELLTELEILLMLPITYPSQILKCVDNLINEELTKEQKGGVTFGR